MRILYLTSRLPWPPDRGDRVRTFHFLRSMAARHHVRLLSLVAGRTDARSLAELQKLGAEVETVPLARGASLARMVAALPSRNPFQVAYYRSARMARRVAACAADRDLVIAHLIRTAPYLEVVPARVRRIVDLCDCISSEYVASLPHRRGAAFAFYREEAARVARYEQSVIASADETWVVSAAEAEKLGGASRLHVLPNGVHVPEAPFARAGSGTGPRIIFTGNLSVPHNVDAAKHLVRDILPRVLRELPDAAVTLAGADPGPAVRALAGPRVDVTGWVDDLPGLLAGADVFLAPMRYVAGVQNKVLEAMASGLPVVTTAPVQRGIGAEPGRHLLVGSDAAALAAGVVELARDPGRSAALGEAARAFVRASFSWDAVLHRLDDLADSSPR